HVPKVDAEVHFNQSEVTEYELLLEDNSGQVARRSFLVHPLSNVAPEIRITAPADQQYIVAGTFQIQVGVVATDDRQLEWEKLELYANGVSLGTRVSKPSGIAGGDGVLQQAFNEIYDAYEDKYSLSVADQFGQI